MLRIASALFVASLAFTAPAIADDLPTDSKISAVTVYTNRAKVERRAVIEVPKGAHTVIFKDVPAEMQPDSLRAEGSAAADVTIGALAHKKSFTAELTAPREKELQAQLEKLGDQRQLLFGEKQALEEEKNFIQTLSKQAALRTGEDIAEIDLKPEQWAGAAGTIRENMGTVMKNLAENNVKIRELGKEIDKLNRELGQLRTGQKESWEVTVPVEAAEATSLTLTISYQMQQATWQPLYDARLDTESGELELVQYGQVRQHTGEDWDGVALTLSTAQPARGAGLPELDPMWVDIYQAVAMRQNSKVMGLAAPQSARMEEFAMADAAMAPMESFEREARKASFRTANIETGGFVSAYKIPGPSTIPADGTATKLMIGGFETDSDLQIHVKPQVDNNAYLVSHLKLKGETPILPGGVNLFRDGAYVGQARLPLLRPDEEQDLPFGIDDQVAVKRRTLKDERSEAGMISRDNVLERHYITELQNLHNFPVKLMVLETVPVSKNEKINVDILKDATTAGYVADKDNVKGLLQWTVPMEPKSSQNVRLGWKVSWPKDANISGL